LSSDPEKSISGEVGEGTGIRDDINDDLSKSDEILEEAVIKKPLTLIGKHSQIRCHRCGTSKNLEDMGKFIQINNFIAWFHNKECHDLWIDGKDGEFKTGAEIDQYGKVI